MQIFFSFFCVNQILTNSRFDHNYFFLFLFFILDLSYSYLLYKLIHIDYSQYLYHYHDDCFFLFHFHTPVYNFNFYHWQNLYQICWKYMTNQVLESTSSLLLLEGHRHCLCCKSFLEHQHPCRNSSCPHHWDEIFPNFSRLFSSKQFSSFSMDITFNGCILFNWLRVVGIV